ncbi:hypothetical protein ROT00_17295 [Agromyces mediolanus]|uniref:hypothetical protein n=1 Tax=Agromyces mediolanus TaxID=41986 RepID=UPI003833AE18
MLALAAASLGAAGFLQGPKLVDAAVDVQRATRLAESRLVLQLNQPVAEAGALRVSPDEPASLDVDGDRLVVTFERPLPANTEFRVAVTDVVGAAQPSPAEVSYRFTTADEPVFTLVRRSADGRPDVVRRASPAEPAPRDVLEAPRLQSFAAAGEVVVAAAIEEDGTNTLRVAGIGGATQTVGLPEPGVVRRIAASTTHPLVALSFDGRTNPGGGEPRFRHALFTLDVSGAQAALEPVLRPDGEPFAVADWRFVPGTTSLVLQDLDGGLFVVDALGLSPPMALGAHAELRGILPGTAVLVVADPDGGARIDLTTGGTSANELPRAGLPEQAYPGRVQQLDAAGAYVMDVLLASSGGAESLVVLVDGGGTEIRYASGPGSRLAGSCVSPNGRLVAIETVAADAPYDGYPNLPSPVDRLTTVVDLDSGDPVLVQNGGFSDWCG